MNIVENIRIAIFSIRTNITRSLLTMLGIIIGVASVIAIVTVGNGGRDYIVGMIESMGSNMVSITVAADAATSSDYITDDDIEAIKRLDSVGVVSPMAFNMAACESTNENGTAMIMAGTTDLQYIMNSQMLYGRFYNEADYEAARYVVCIDNLSAYTLFGKENCVGEKLNLTANGKTVAFKIIGVGDNTSMMNADVESMSQMMESGSAMGTMVTMMIPSTTFNEFFGQSGRYQMVYLTANDDRFLDSAGASAVNVLKIRHSNSDREIYKVTNMATYIELVDTVINVFTAFIAAVGAISLVVGGIGVMNIMLVSVT
ncbi:MAG: ABC transporter permease, partial [Clostridia bacterium]|nr:ABC transporter permease [Clostridia bacterium]